MTKRLTGRNVLAYLGVNTTTPPNTRQAVTDPRSTDYKNFTVGDIWINTSNEKVWILVGKPGG